MATNNAAKTYVTAVEAVYAKESLWRQRMLDPATSRAHAAKETEEIQRLSDAMKECFVALGKADS